MQLVSQSVFELWHGGGGQTGGQTGQTGHGLQHGHTGHGGQVGQGGHTGQGFGGQGGGGQGGGGQISLSEQLSEQLFPQSPPQSSFELYPQPSLSS